MEEVNRPQIKTIAIHQKNPVFVLGYANGVIELVGANGAIKKIDGHKEGSAVTALDMHPRFPLILSAGDDLTVKITNYETMAVVCRFEKCHKDVISSANFRGATTFFLSASLDNSVILWDYQNDKRIIGLKFKEPITYALFTPTEKIIASTTHTILSCDLNPLKKIFSVTCTEAQNINCPHMNIQATSTKPCIAQTNYPIKQILLSKQNLNLALITKFEIILLTTEGREICRKREASEIFSAHWICDVKLIYTTCREIKYYKITGTGGNLLYVSEPGFIIGTSSFCVRTIDLCDKIVLEHQTGEIKAWDKNLSLYVDPGFPDNSAQVSAAATLADVGPIACPNDIYTPPPELKFKGKLYRGLIGIYPPDFSTSVSPVNTINKKKN